MRAIGGGGRAPFGVSPYASARMGGGESALVDPILQGLPDKFNPELRKQSLPFSELAEALEVLSSAKTKVLQGEILRDLFRQTIAAAGNDKQSAELEMYLLLKMLMPTEDHESVYGMKTVRLLRFVGQALSKNGIPDAIAQMNQWISKPQAQSSIMARGRGVVCLPELIVASQCCRVSMVPHDRRIVAAVNNRGVVTLQDIGALCKSLSRAYLMMDSNLTGAESNQIESLNNILGYLSFNEWILLTRIIYKTIPVGIGPAAILSNVARNGQLFYSKQRDLVRLAKCAVADVLKHSEDDVVGGSDPNTVPSLICGVPFIPMTCETMKSPYLFRWLFSKEDKLRKPISPVDGRLIILSNGMWCTPVDGRLNKSVFVDIMDDRAMAKASRRRHVLLLREFKRSRFLDESEARGLIIHYILSSENDNVVMMLLKAVSDAVGQGASTLDSTYQIESREDDIGIDNGTDELEDEIYVNALLKKLVKNNDEREYLSGKNKLKISILSAPKKRPRRTKKKVVATRPKTTTKTKGASSSSSKAKTKTAANVAASVAKQTKNKKDKENGESLVSRYNLRSRNSSGNKRGLNISSSSSGSDDDDNVQSNGVSGSSNQPIVIVDGNEDEGEKPSVMVQQKYDGDRIQVHINLNNPSLSASEIGQTTTVTLFTKWGKDVSMLYSNIRDELNKSQALVHHAPCILDAELIVVDVTGKPLPWSNEKWRHNVKGRASFPLGEVTSTHLLRQNSEGDGDISQVVTIIYDGLEGGQATINNNSEDIQDQRLAFATLKGLERWEGLGPTDKKHMKGRFISDVGAKLRLIAFDILMHKGEMCHRFPCRDRLNLLVKELDPIFQPMTHIRVIEKTHSVRKVSELLEILRNVVSEKQEGLVAKDEEKEYVFGKTKSTQKIKLTGPDINTCVAGIGFSLSSNPRFCGILTAVGWTDDVDDAPENRKDVLVSYSRTEVLEGDQIWKAHEHIMSLPSRVNIEELEKASSSRKAIELEKYRVTMISTGSRRTRGDESNDIRQVEWVPRSSENAHLGCKLILLKRGRADIQWLCNPRECKFGISLKGDLRPIESDEYGNETIMHHRHPVGRIEFAGHQMSAWDSNQSIKMKFQEAQETATCIEDFTYRRINRMRALPPSKKKLEEIRRVVETIRFLKNNEPASEEEWPRPPPVGFCSPDGFSLMLETVSKYPPISPKLKKSQENALKKLTPDERQAWVGLPVHSQWKNMGSVAPPLIPRVDDALSQERQRANIETLMTRYQRIKKVLPPFEQEYKLPSTSQKFTSEITKSTATTKPKCQSLQLHSLPNSSSYAEHSMLCGKCDSHFLDSESDIEDEEEDGDDDDDDNDNDTEDDDGEEDRGFCDYEDEEGQEKPVDDTPLHYLLHPHAHGATLPYSRSVAPPPPFRGLHHEKNTR